MKGQAENYTARYGKSIEVNWVEFINLYFDFENDLKNKEKYLLEINYTGANIKWFSLMESFKPLKLILINCTIGNMLYECKLCWDNCLTLILLIFNDELIYLKNWLSLSLEQ